MPSADCSLPGCKCGYLCRSSSHTVKSGRGLHGDAMRWGYNTGPRGNREMGGRGEAGVRAWRAHRA